MDWSGIKIIEKSNFYRIYNYEIMKYQNATEKSLLNSFFIISLNYSTKTHFLV